jgi:hypothetical protein
MAANARGVWLRSLSRMPRQACPEPTDTMNVPMILMVQLK